MVPRMADEADPSELLLLKTLIPGGLSPKALVGLSDNLEVLKQPFSLNPINHEPSPHVYDA